MMTPLSAPANQLVAVRAAPQQATSGSAIRLAERIAAATAFVACAPVVIVSAIAIQIVSGQSPFVAHRRVGLGGAEFWMLKLRTMWDRDAQPRRSRLVEQLPATWVP